jgi:methylenetetrahydrofolate reductase (NADPH)
VADAKIIDLMKDHPTAFTSLEFFPPRTEEGVANLKDRIIRMRDSTKPVFMDVTWGAGGSTSDLTMDLVSFIKESGIVANMHLTCTNMSDGTVDEALQAARNCGIRNIVALRGDPPEGKSDWTASEGGFTCALDLVKFIRKKYGSEFGISVAGYPEGHPNAISVLAEGDEAKLTASEKLRCSKVEGKVCVCKDADYKKEMDYLKQKVDAGADFVITQMFFDAEVYGNFIKDCIAWGINCPIVPGIMCINNFAGFFRMTGFCKTRVPAELEAALIEVKDDAQKLKEFGVKFGAEMCMRVLALGAPCVHFYTLNLEKVVYGILDALGWTVGLSDKLDVDADANSMKAVGSAWARVGDDVMSMFGAGTIQEMRKDGSAAIELKTWKLAGGQAPRAWLKAGTYTKMA